MRFYVNQRIITYHSFVITEYRNEFILSIISTVIKKERKKREGRFIFRLRGPFQSPKSFCFKNSPKGGIVELLRHFSR